MNVLKQYCTVGQCECLTFVTQNGTRRGGMLTVIKDVRKLRGGSQPHLMQASDGQYYVVKLQGNPQGSRILANELLANRIADALKLPFPRTEVIYLPPEISKGITF